MAYIDEQGYAVFEDRQSRTNESSSHTNGREPRHSKKALVIAIIVIVIICMIILFSQRPDQTTPATIISASNKGQAPMTDVIANDTPTQTLKNGEADPEQFYLELDSRVIQEKELYGYSRVQLQYIINALYAMQGRSFNAQEYIDYFNSKAWYHSKSITDEQAVASMNDIMLKNLEILVQYRTKKGWNK